MSLSLPHFQLDSPQELLPWEVPGGHEPPQPSPGWGQDEAAAGKAQGRAELLAPARDARAARGRGVPQPPGSPPGRLGALVGFYSIRVPFSSVSGSGCGCVVWNTFLIKPGNERGARVVHAAPRHGAAAAGSCAQGSMGWGRRGCRDGVSITTSSCLVPRWWWHLAASWLVTLASAPLGHLVPLLHVGHPPPRSSGGGCSTQGLAPGHCSCAASPPTACGLTAHLCPWAACGRSPPSPLPRPPPAPAAARLAPSSPERSCRSSPVNEHAAGGARALRWAWPRLPVTRCGRQIGKVLGRSRRRREKAAAALRDPAAWPGCKPPGACTGWAAAPSGSGTSPGTGRLRGSAASPPLAQPLVGAAGTSRLCPTCCRRATGTRRGERGHPGTLCPSLGTAPPGTGLAGCWLSQ